MNKTTLQILAIATFIVIVCLTVIDIQSREPEETPSCWANKDPLLLTLQRYSDAYHRLSDEYEKAMLARLYLLTISTEVLVLPLQKNAAKMQVILPLTEQDDDTIMVLREIQLGTTDNGLYDAFQARNTNPWPYEPPGYPAKVEKLINQIISGCKEP